MIGHTDSTLLHWFLMSTQPHSVCVFTSHVGLSRILSHRFLPGKVRTSGAIP